MSWATKYRPETLDEVVGQQTITETLKKEIGENRLKQAYLFVGKAGSGKTTTSRILAKNTNIIEIDVASHNSAESMRELVNTTKNKPIGFDTTTVILDEAHTMSSAAANVLLLTLEEPPSHLRFILCTTEGHKILTTIKTRCEIFEFQPVDIAQIADRLDYICKSENVEYDKSALIEIAQLADGSVRQAIMYLEQLATLGEKVDLRSVRTNLAGSTYYDMMSLILSVGDKDCEFITKLVNTLPNVDLFVEKFFTMLLDLKIYHKTKNSKLVNIPVDLLAKDLNSLTQNDYSNIEMLIQYIYDLQFYAKKSPILRQLFLAMLLKVLDNQKEM